MYNIHENTVKASRIWALRNGYEMGDLQEVRSNKSLSRERPEQDLSQFLIEECMGGRGPSDCGHKPR
jgi:hypothetical protein